MRSKRVKVQSGDGATYHCMTRTVNGTHLFGVREKEVLRKMIWQVADFSGVRVLTYCIMGNHFHVLVFVPPSTGPEEVVSDQELLRRYRVLYPRPTPYQQASLKVLAKLLADGGEEGEAFREQLLARMGDVSEFMKTLKQRFSIWFNKRHERFGTLWAERFKSVLVEGKGNPLQTMAAYIDLNPVRAGLVADPKDYRFCGYAEAVAGNKLACAGLWRIWADHAGIPPSEKVAERQSGWAAACEHAPYANVLQVHRELIFGKRAADPGLPEMSREKALKVLEQENALLPMAAVLRCRVRYFTDGAILGSAEYVRSFLGEVERAQQRKRPLKANGLKGALWGDMAVLQNLRRGVFS
ncbi:MAG: transposase [Opitutales bacterium]